MEPTPPQHSPPENPSAQALDRQMDRRQLDLARQVPLRPRDLRHPDPSARPPRPNRPSQTRVPVAHRGYPATHRRIRHRDRLARSPARPSPRRSAHRPQPPRRTTPPDAHHQYRHLVPAAGPREHRRTDNLRVSPRPWHQLPQMPDMDLPESRRDGSCTRPDRSSRTGLPAPWNPT